MNRLRRSWSLVRASWAVLLAHRSLFAYPLVSGLVVAIVGGLLPLALVWVRLSEENAEFAFSFRGIIGFLLVYVVTCTVVFFCNVALVAELIARFDGLPRATPSGWSVARSELRSIVVHAVLTSTLVSLLFLVINRVGRVFGMPSVLAPDSWSLGPFLAVPILVVERLGPREALERGASLLRSTWGDRFIGSFGVLVVKILMVMSLIVIGVLVIALAALTSFAPLVLVMVIVVVVAVGFVVVTGSAVSMVYGAATYRRVTNQPVEGFEALDGLPNTYLTKEELIDEGAEAPGANR